MAIVERVVKIVNELGLHARPAAAFVKLAGQYQADIQVKRDDMAVNGKSIMGVMTLAAERGSQLLITADGADADAAVQALVALVESGFRE